MADVLKPDICVIGAGAGGMSVAAAVAAFGVPVVLVERRRMDGERRDNGAPLRALAAAADRVARINDASSFGIATEAAKIKFRDVQRHVERVIAALAANGARQHFTALGVRVIEGTARFKDPATVAVEDEAVEIKARRFVIATGSSPAIPPIAGLADARYLTTDTVFDLSACPKHLVVIGAGSVALTLAQTFRRLGAAVTVLDAAQPLAGEDPECAEVVLERLASEGIAIRAGVTIKQIKRARGKVQVLIAGAAGEEAFEASHLLVACGRTPDVEALDLAAANITHAARGIVVDRALKTSNKRVYAIGDVAGDLVGEGSVQRADHQAALIVRNALFRLPIRADDDRIPRLTTTDPELAHVGLTEADARRRGYRLRILRWPLRENDRAQAERALVGHIKVIATARGRILGATIVGRGAGELIAPWALALQRRLNISALAGMIVPYPTFTEIGRRAAISYYGGSLTSPLLRRVIGVLRRLG